MATGWQRHWSRRLDGHKHNGRIGGDDGEVALDGQPVKHQRHPAQGRVVPAASTRAGQGWPAGRAAERLAPEHRVPELLADASSHVGEVGRAELHGELAVDPLERGRSLAGRRHVGPNSTARRRAVERVM